MQAAAVARKYHLAPAAATVVRSRHFLSPASFIATGCCPAAQAQHKQCIMHTSTRSPVPSCLVSCCLVLPAPVPAFYFQRGAWQCEGEHPCTAHSSKSHAAAALAHATHVPIIVYDVNTRT